MEKAEYAEFNVATCGNIAVCELCRERQSSFQTAFFFPTTVIFAGLPIKAFPRKQAKVDFSAFLVVA